MRPKSRDAKGRLLANAAGTRALGRKGKKVSPWRFGCKWLKLPPKPDWVK